MPGIKTSRIFYRRGVPNGNINYGFQVYGNYSIFQPQSLVLNPYPNIPPPPNPPTNVTAVAIAIITWTASTGNVTSYTVKSNPGNYTATVSGNLNTANVLGLSPGISYTFTVTATSQSLSLIHI